MFRVYVNFFEGVYIYIYMELSWEKEVSWEIVVSDFGGLWAILTHDVVTIIPKILGSGFPLYSDKRVGMVVLKRPSSQAGKPASKALRRPAACEASARTKLGCGGSVGYLLRKYFWSCFSIYLAQERFLFPVHVMSTEKKKIIRNISVQKKFWNMPIT